MWDRVISHLPKYPSAVLTAMDEEGYPYSLRCSPEVDSTRQVLVLALPGYVSLLSGPAGLLCHYHDDLLWNQTYFVLRGTLENLEGQWVFRPSQFLEGAGAGMSLIRQIREGRRAARQYLVKRGIERPRIPWDRLKAIYEHARNTES